jgi:hypothetical protein
MLTRRQLDGEEPGDEPWSRQSLHAAIRANIGKALRARYEPPQELPHQISVLLMQLDQIDEQKKAHAARQRKTRHGRRASSEVLKTRAGARRPNAAVCRPDIPPGETS